MALETLETKEQKILYVASHGMEDSYRATLIFAAAKAAKAAGAGDVKVALLGEATWLANQDIQNNFSLGHITYRGMVTRPQLSSLIRECVRRGVKIGI
jgi:predicted peroxiredoxin